MTVSWGLVSTAPINLKIIAAAERSELAQVIAVGSRDTARAESYAREHGIDRGYGRYETLLEDDEVDAVYISLPNGLHVEWTIRALEAGKHVLCEKPMSRHLDEVERAFDLAESRGLVLSEGFMWRHHPQTSQLVRLVSDGAIGALRLVRAAFSFPLAIERGPNDARFDPDLDGGAMMDVGCYCVSAIRLLAGEPESLAGMQSVGPSGVDVVFAGTMRHAADVVSQFDCGFVVPRRAGLEVLGEDASLFVPTPFVVTEPGIELRRDGDVEQVAVEDEDSYLLELDNVSGAIRGDSPLLLGREDAVGQAKTIEALYGSAA
ncbi:MAG TPA: Gfo/Idh/MocA family oxidoreductase [Gaiellaceae bacterium]|jgi:predicted dehydrogenase|nr:Gfo/Idh/MocA family oxidoreductase [Gaiellaceae bacterium]